MDILAIIAFAGLLMGLRGLMLLSQCFRTNSDADFTGIDDLKPLDVAVAFLIALLLGYSGAILLSAYLRGVDLGEWVWRRHQNQFSWYSRPLFVLPACYYAYRRKLWYIVSILVLLGTSLFWFSAPESPAQEIVGYLNWEKEFFITNPNPAPLILLISAVVGFLVLLFHAFWKRNLWIGLVTINVGTLLKIIVSIYFGGTAGYAAILPSLSSLFVINLVAFLIYRYRRKKKR